MKSRLAVLCTVCLLVGTLPASAGAIGSSATATPTGTNGTLSVTADGSTDTIEQETVLRHLPDRVGEFEAEATFRVPDSVSEFEIELEPEATVESTDGFEQTGETTYRWTESTTEPTVRYVMPADRTGTSGPQATHHTHDDHHGDTGYTFVDTGDWAVVQVPGVGISVQGTAAVGLEESVQIDGEGATGGDIAFFGPVTEYEGASDREDLRLAVADDAQLTPTPETVLDSLVEASDRLDVGASHDEVFVVVVPTEGIEWAARGIQYGSADAWVGDDAQTREARNVWLHEYVHVRQAFANPDVGTAAETEWLIEGQADYHAALLAFEQELIGFDAFADTLAEGTEPTYADAVLADPTSWTDERTDYATGALVAGELDRQLRLATDGDRTIDDVFRTLNRNEGPVTEGDLLDAIETEGGAELRSIAERYTQTEQTPEMWSQADHEEAFDGTTAAFVAELTGESIEIGGDTWDHSSAADSTDRITVPVGEEIRVPASMANAGDRDGTGDVTLTADGDVVDHQRTVLDAGEETAVMLSWTPSSPGEYDVRVGSDRLSVLVRSAASVAVTDLTVEPDGADPGDDVTATATVEAADDRTGAAVLDVLTPSGTEATVPVVVEPGERETIEATLTFDDPGEYEVVVGDQSTMVSIGSSELDVTDAVPGFGVVGAIGALLLVAGVLYGRRSRCHTSSENGSR